MTTLAGPATAADNGRVLQWFPDRSGLTVVTSGLNNPRQISLIGGDGIVAIGEAGKGGPDCEIEGEDTFWVGNTGAISAVFVPQFGANRGHVDIVTGLQSGAGPDGPFAVGSQGVSARNLGEFKIVSDFDGDVLKARPFGAVQIQTNIGEYQAANDPNGQGVESNPYSVLALPGRTLVADAAANTIVSVADDGTISTFAVMANITDGLCADVPNDNGTTGATSCPPRSPRDPTERSTSVASARRHRARVGS